jgi:hypothetical protein
MKWNFCPWCGHRIYQHSISGCTHTFITMKTEWIDGFNRRKIEPCDCTTTHEFLEQVRGD